MVNNSHGFNLSKCSVKCNSSFGKSNTVEVKRDLSVCQYVKRNACGCAPTGIFP